MAESSVEVLIEKPVEVVFATLLDDEKTKEWLTGFDGIETLEGTAGEVGCRSKVSFSQKGRTVELIETILSRTDNEEISFQFESKPMVAFTQVRLTPEWKSTRLTATTRVEPKGWINRLLLPLMKSAMRNRQAQDYERFKGVVEAL